MENEVIKCHEGMPMYLSTSVHWRGAIVKTGDESNYWDNRPFRTCSYCGSMHPEDLLKAVERGALVTGSDWKYGWPHKFYVDGIPSVLEGVDCVVGMGSKQDGNKPIWGKGSKAHGKWYNVHLKDLTLQDFEKVSEVLLKEAHIAFAIDQEQHLAWAAPYAGYQRIGPPYEKQKIDLKVLEDLKLAVRKMVRAH